MFRQHVKNCKWVTSTVQSFSLYQIKYITQNIFCVNWQPSFHFIKTFVMPFFYVDPAEALANRKSLNSFFAFFEIKYYDKIITNFILLTGLDSSFTSIRQIITTIILPIYNTNSINHTKNSLHSSNTKSYIHTENIYIFVHTRCTVSRQDSKSHAKYTCKNLYCPSIFSCFFYIKYFTTWQRSLAHSKNLNASPFRRYVKNSQINL